jgi:hypothetical protein
MREYQEREQIMIPAYRLYHQLLVDPDRSRERIVTEETGIKLDQLRNFLDERGFEGIHGYPLERPNVPHMFMISLEYLAKDFRGTYYDAWHMRSASEVMESTGGLVPDLKTWGMDAVAGFIELQMIGVIETLGKEGFYPCPAGQRIKLYTRDEPLLEIATYLGSLWNKR